jgi:hypothetical protein
MESIIERIFIENQFVLIEKREAILFFQNRTSDCSSYYLVDFTEFAELRNYVNGNRIERIQEFFDSVKVGSADVEKNTSLILCVKAHDLTQEIEIHKNEILAVEEDEFYFKKYALIYSENGIKNFKDAEKVTAVLSATLLDINNFNQYHDTLQQDATYHFVLQVFLKLPFLFIPILESDGYKSIREIFEGMVDNRQVLLMEKVVKNEALLEKKYWDDLRRLSLNINIDNDALYTEFFNYFRNL